MKIAVIGTPENIFSYKMAGLKTFEVKTVQDAESILSQQNTSIVFLEEKFFKKLDIKHIKQFVIPLIFSTSK